MDMHTNDIIQFKMNIPNEDCISLLRYMCKKIGIDVSCKIMNTRIDYPHLYRCIAGTCCGHELHMNKDIMKYANVYYSRALNYSIHSMFSYSYDVVDALMFEFVFRIRSFGINGLKLCIGNPYFGFIDIMECKTLDEAKIAVDLFYPDDISCNVTEAVMEKEYERRDVNEPRE